MELKNETLIFDERDHELGLPFYEVSVEHADLVLNKVLRLFADEHRAIWGAALEKAERGTFSAEWLQVSYYSRRGMDLLHVEAQIRAILNDSIS